MLNPQELLENEELRIRINRALYCLNYREAAVLRKRFGFGGEEEARIKIAEELELSPARIRQIEFQAIRKLRHLQLKSFINEGKRPIKKLLYCFNRGYREREKRDGKPGFH